MPRITGSALLSAHGNLEKTIAALDGGSGDPAFLPDDWLSLVLATARDALAEQIPDLVILATTKGDLPRWRATLRTSSDRNEGSPSWLANQIAQVYRCPGLAISSACASGPLALGVAARGILAGRWRRVLVLGADHIDDFIVAGFASLKAIDPTRCRPFDAQRAGLRLGELIAAVVLEPAGHNGDGGQYLQGWAGGMDANHLTGPTRDGSGLARTLQSALQRAGGNQPSLVIAHGTGTRYNDDSESLAYATVCPDTPVTAFKGLLGHSLGACGIAELALAAVIQQRQRTPGCTNLQQAGCAGAIRLLPPGVHQLGDGPILLANAGFGGLNGAVVLGNKAATPRPMVTPRRCAWARLDAHGWQRERVDGSSDESIWSEPGESDSLPRLSARCVLGKVDATWGRMDLPCRALVALGHLLSPLPAEAAIVLATTSGSAASDRLHDHAVCAGAVDPQRFPYTLPTTPIGEASIRLAIRGPGFSVHGADRQLVHALAHDLLQDGIPGVLIAWIEADQLPHQAYAEWWTCSPA